MKFKILKSTDNKFYFNLVARNGETVATSETYERKQAAKDTIRAIRLEANTAEIIDESNQ